MPAAIVVGGGISGVACARALEAAGVEVEVRERAHRLGGRMASRRLRGTGSGFDGRVVDIGASYFTVSDPLCAAVIATLEAEDVVRPWTSGFHVAGPEGMRGVAARPVRFAAPGGLRSVVEALAAGLSRVRLETPVASSRQEPGGVVVDGQLVRAVALCLPYPQAARIADLPADPITWEPVIAVTCVFSERRWMDLDGVFVNDDPVLTWIADDGSRRGDGAPVLVAHVHPVLSLRHLDDPAAVIGAAVAAVQRVLGLDAYPDWVDAHRWTFARPLAARSEDFWLEGGVGRAGDAFADGPRVEAAWLSGHRLGQALAETLTSSG